MEQSTNILENLNRQIGESGLIIHAKAMAYFTSNKITINEVERLLLLISSNEIQFNNEMTKIKILSILLYLQAEYDVDKASVFSAKIEQWQNSNRNLLRSSVTLDHLHIIFNIIEFEDKFRMMNSDKLKLLNLHLNTFEKLEKPFEDYILFKYYTGTLKYHQKEYQNAKMASMDILIDITEEIQNKSDKSALLEYIEMKNQILNMKIVEKESNDKEILTNLDSLLENYSSQSSDLTIQLGFKASDVYFNNYGFDKAYTVLQLVFKKIKNQLLFGNMSKFPEFTEIHLNIICRIIFANIIIGVQEESIKFIKKLEKLLNMVKEQPTKSKDAKENLIAKFYFYLIIFKFICKIGTIDKNELNNSINNYRTKFKNQINSEDNVIINIYALNSSDVLARNFFDKVNTNMSIIQNNKLIPVNYISLFFSLYNQISILTKNIATDSNVKKQLEYVEKIKVSSKALVDYVNKYIDNNSDIKFFFSYNYFKEVLIKVFIAYIFTFYYSKDYKKALELIQEFELVKTKLNLQQGIMMKHYAGIIKLKADILFKIEDYKEAANYYLKVVNIYEEVLNHSQAMAQVLFNLGITYLYIKDYPLAKKNLALSKGKYELLNSINNGQFTDKLKQIGQVLEVLSPIINSE